MQLDWYKIPARKRPRIKLLTSGFGNGAGEIIRIDLETDNEIYYNDGFKRWVYLYKNEEGTSFEYIKRGNMESLV